MKYKVLLTVLAMSLLSCSENKKTIIQQIEGEKTVLDNSGKITQKGFFKEGFKVKEWSYNAGNNSYSIAWEVHKSEKFMINVPNDWKIEIDSGLIFGAYGEILGSSGQLSVIAKLNSNKEEYLSNYLKDLQKKDIVGYKVSKFVSEDKTIVDVVSSSIKHNSKQLNIMTMLLEKDGVIYDFTYFFYDKEFKKVHYYMFIDFASSFKHLGKFLFDHSKNSPGFLDWSEMK